MRHSGIAMAHCPERRPTFIGSEDNAVYSRLQVLGFVLMEERNHGGLDECGPLACNVERRPSLALDPCRDVGALMTDSPRAGKSPLM